MNFLSKNKQDTLHICLLSQVWDGAAEIGLVILF